jgi:tetratricopeptide (TPR) repeat protein
MTESTRTRWLLPLLALLLGVVLVGGLALLTPTEPANETAVAAANALVENGHAAEAVEIYEQLITAGAHDATLYYNLGNAYFRTGDLARAVDSYTLAADLAPRDDDIRANLELALRQSPALAPAQPSGASGFLSALTSGWLSLDEAAVLVMVLWFAGMLLVLVTRLRPNTNRWIGRLAVALLVAALVVGLSLGSRALERTPAAAGQPPAVEVR